MYQNKLRPNNSTNSSHKYIISNPFLNQTNFCGESKCNSFTPEEKSICQKYLNIYESIKRKQPSQFMETNKNSIEQQKKYIGKKKGIFENDLIQNTYPKKQIEEITEKTYISHINCQNSGQANLSYGNSQRKVTVPSRKNQAALEMIAQNKEALEAEKQNKQSLNIEIKGQYILEDNFMKQTGTLNNSSLKNLITDKYQIYSNFQKLKSPSGKVKRYLFNEPVSYWKTRQFLGSDTKKAYGGYFKAKSKLKYQKQKQKCLRISSSFIKKIDDSIENQRIKRLILRPKTCQTRNKQMEFNSINSASQNLRNLQINKKANYGSHQKMIKTKSQAILQKELKIQQKPEKKVSYFGLIRKSKSNTMTSIEFLFNGREGAQFQRKNSKKLKFHSKIHSPTKNYYSNTQKQHFYNSSDLGIITQSIYDEKQNLHQSQFPSKADQSYFNDHSESYLQSKLLFHKNKGKYNSNFKVFHENQNKTQSLHQSQVSKKRQNLALNKIQDSIENDLQLIIRQVGSKIVCPQNQEFC